jgi:hypothetical protein
VLRAVPAISYVGWVLRLFGRIGELKPLVQSNGFTVWTINRQTAFGSVGSVRPQGIVWHRLCTWFDFTVSEPSIAPLAHQRPLRHLGFSLPNIFTKSSFAAVQLLT